MRCRIGKKRTKNTRKYKKKKEIDRSIDLFKAASNKRFNFERDTHYSQIMSTTRSSDTDDTNAFSTTFIKVAFDSSSLRPTKFSNNFGSLITAESRREYLSLTSVVRWHQSTSDVEIHVRLPRGASEKKGDVSVSVTSTSIRVRLRGPYDWGTKKEPLAGTLFRRIKRDESSWTSVRKRHMLCRIERTAHLSSLFLQHIDDRRRTTTGCRRAVFLPSKG